MPLSYISTKVFDSFPSAVYICDPEGRLQYYNKRAAELWGRMPPLNDESEKFCGCHKAYTMEGKAVSKDLVPMVSVLKGSQSVKDLKVILERPDGSKVTICVSISPIRGDDGKILGAINIFQDITEQHNLETRLHAINQELKWNSEELEQMAYSVSHDLKEPLRVATTYIQLLSKKYKGKLDDKADNYITTAVKSCERVRQLINGLLEFNRVRGQYSAFSKVDLNEVLEQALVGLKLTIEEHGAVIKSDHLPTVFGDATKISLVFQNLIGNAIKFCTHGLER